MPKEGNAGACTWSGEDIAVGDLGHRKALRVQRRSKGIRCLWGGDLWGPSCPPGGCLSVPSLPSLTPADAAKGLCH